MANESGRPSDFEGRITATIRRLEERINARAGFDGTQLTRTVQKLQELLDGLLTQVNGVFSGTLSVTGRSTLTGGITSTDVRARTVTVGYSAVYADVNGIFGANTSSRRYKQDIAAATMDLDGILRLTPRRYRRRAAVEEMGADAPVEIGLIAEDVEKVAPWLVFHDADGLVQGIRYEMLSVALLGIVKTLDERVRALEDQSQ